MGVVPKKLRQAFAGIFISATLQPLSSTAVIFKKIFFYSLNEDDALIPFQRRHRELLKKKKTK